MASRTNENRHEIPVQFFLNSVRTQKIKLSTKCQICFNLFNTDSCLPKLLPCGHNFCQSCIDGLRAQLIYVIRCPICRTPTMQTRDTVFPTNYGLVELLANLEDKPRAAGAAAGSRNNQTVENGKMRRKSQELDGDLELEDKSDYDNNSEVKDRPKTPSAEAVKSDGTWTGCTLWFFTIFMILVAIGIAILWVVHLARLYIKSLYPLSWFCSSRAPIPGVVQRFFGCDVDKFEWLDRFFDLQWVHQLLGDSFSEAGHKFVDIWTNDEKSFVDKIIGMAGESWQMIEAVVLHVWYLIAAGFSVAGDKLHEFCNYAFSRKSHD